ncbi:MAG: hypothetical protein P1V97_02220, partial [Planctomycetota bacterium]|nr:hypothetical protein [Planctomycetota bacterium]
ALKKGDISGLWASQKNRFITYLTLSLNYQLSGTDTQSYHWVNILIHSLNGCLLFALALLLNTGEGSQKSRITWALGTALLFTLHPLGTSSVTYIVQRAESLCAFFLLGALLCYGLGRKSQAKKRACGLYGLSLFMGIAALLCKEVAAIGAALILAFEWILLNKEQGFKAKWKAVINTRSTWPWFALLALTGLGLFVSGQSAQLFQSIESKSVGSISYFDYQLTQTKVLLRYIQLSILPVGQSIDHDVSLITSFWSFGFIASIAALGVLGYGAYQRSKAEPRVCFAVIATLIVLAPSSSVFVLPDLIFEHRFYLPLAFLALYGAAELRRLPRGSLFVLAILLVALSSLTLHRNRVWQTEASLWLDALEKAPSKERSLINAANALGDESIWGLETSSKSFIYAKKTKPESADSSFMAVQSRGLILQTEIARKQSPSELSRDLYLQVLEQNPRSSKARVNLALTYIVEGQSLLKESSGEDVLTRRKRQQASRLCFLNGEFHLKRALRDKADDFIAYNNLGQLYLNYLDRPKEAESCFREVLRLTKSLPSPWFFLGTILLKQSKLKEAIECFQTYLSLHESNQGHSKLKDACVGALKNAQEALKKRS